MYKILNPQPTIENPYIVEDYPYGFTARTQMRVYTEFRKGKGYRYVTQTLNPKTGNWNKPKAGTYAEMILVYQDPVDGHIHPLYGSGYNQEELDKFIETAGEILNDEPYKTQIRILRARLNAQKHLVWKVVAPGEARPIADQMKDINNAVAYEYVKLVKSENG